MPSQIDNAPLQTEIKVGPLRFRFSETPVWALWLPQIVTALFRPTKTASLAFAATGAQSSRDVVVNFPPGTVSTADVPVLAAPAPPANTAFTCHIAAKDQVTVRFNNYSSGAVAVALSSFTITILKA